MLKRSNESEKHVQAVVKALEILNCFEDSPALSLRDIHELTGINKTRIMRLVGTLHHMGYLVQDPVSMQYLLGPRVVSLGKGFLNDHFGDMRKILRPYLKNLAEEIGETVSFFVIHGFSRLCLVREEARSAIRYVIKEGEERPLYRGAPSKVLLAFTTEQQQEALLSHFKHILGDHVALKQLRRQLKLTRDQGYSLSFAEVSPDSYALAVPVFSNTGTLKGALTISGPVSRFQEEEMGKILQNLKLYSKILEKLIIDQKR